MKKLLDRIKQGLRSIGRGNIEREPPDPTARSDEAAPVPRMRTELDAADGRTKTGAPAQPQAQPQQPTSLRLRKATLSKARRTGPSQNAPSLWGTAPPAVDGLFGTPAEPLPLLSGATLVGHLSTDTERAQRPRTAGGFLEGVPSFGRPADSTNHGDTLFGPAPSLTPSEEPKDRLF